MYLYISFRDADLFGRLTGQLDLPNLSFSRDALHIGCGHIGKCEYQISLHCDKSIDVEGTRLSGNGILLKCTKTPHDKGGGGYLAENFTRVLADIDLRESAKVAYSISNIRGNAGNIRGTLQVDMNSRAAKLCVAKALAMSGNPEMLAAYFECFARNASRGQPRDVANRLYRLADNNAYIAWDLPRELCNVLLYDNAHYRVFDTVVSINTKTLVADPPNFVVQLGYIIRALSQGSMRLAAAEQLESDDHKEFPFKGAQFQAIMAQKSLPCYNEEQQKYTEDICLTVGSNYCLVVDGVYAQRKGVNETSQQEYRVGPSSSVKYTECYGCTYVDEVQLHSMGAGRGLD